jgi:Fe-S-cluster containining protein
VWVPDERFSCQSCGRCCTRWTITVDESKVAQLRKQDWGEADPFVARRGGEGADAFATRMVNGRCFFLDDDNRCRIHGKLGYDAKPDGCKAFPLHVGKVAGESYLRLSFWCPAVLKGEGKRLGEQQKWIKATLKTAGDVERKVPLQLVPELELSERELSSVEAAILELWKSGEGSGATKGDELSIADRLAAGAALIGRLGAAARKGGKAALAPALREAAAAKPAELAVEGRTGGSKARARAVLSLFLGQDRRPGALSGVGHFFGVRLFNVGLGRLRSHLLGGARASRGALARVRFDPAPASRTLLLRYLEHKLRARRTLAGELTLQSGYALLVAAYATVELLARLRAAAAGREACGEEDIANAVQTADLLVVEHSTLYQGSLVGMLTERVLAGEDTAASLLSLWAR